MVITRDAITSSILQVVELIMLLSCPDTDTCKCPRSGMGDDDMVTMTRSGDKSPGNTLR